MATDPKISLNVDTSDAVKNLLGLEGQAIETDGSIEKIDGSSVSVDTTATQKALQDVADKLEKVDSQGQKAGKQGIPVTTNAFKDLTEGIGGPATGAIGSAFAFGQTIEGLGDIVEGFGGKMGLTEGQIGKVTGALGIGLGVLGAVGVAFTAGKAALDMFNEGSRKAAEDQKKFKDAVDASEKSLRGVAAALSEGDKLKAFQDIASDMEPILQNLSDAGLNASDAILEIAGSSTKFTDSANKRKASINDQIKALEALRMKERDANGEIINKSELNIKIAALKDERDALKDVTEAVEIRRQGVKGAIDIDKLANDALADLNTTTEESIQLQLDAAEATLDNIDATRQFERSLDDTQTALDEYNQAVKDAKGDTEAIDDAARDAADTVIDLAGEFGGLEGAAKGTEEWQTRTSNALGYVAATLSPDDPLRKRLLDYKAELDSIPAVKSTAISATYPGMPLVPGGQAVATPGQKLFGAPGTTNTTINVTVTSADPQAVVKALQTYVRQNGSLPANLR